MLETIGVQSHSSHKGAVGEGTGLATRGPSGEMAVTPVPQAPSVSQEGLFAASTLCTKACHLNRLVEDVTRAQHATDVALAGANLAVTVRGEAVNKRMRGKNKFPSEEGEYYARCAAGAIAANKEYLRGKAKTNIESAIPEVSPVLPVLEETEVEEDHTLDEIISNLNSIQFAPRPIGMDDDNALYGTTEDKEWLATLTKFPSAEEWLDSQDKRRAWERITEKEIADKRAKLAEQARLLLAEDIKRKRLEELNKSNDRKLFRSMLRVGVDRMKRIQFIEEQSRMWGTVTPGELQLVEEDGDYIMSDAPGAPPPPPYPPPPPIPEEVGPVHGPVNKDVEMVDPLPSSTGSTLSWDAHVAFSDKVSKTGEVGMRSWYDWWGITRFVNKAQTANDAAVGVARYVAFDDVDGNHVDVKPVVKTWDYFKGKVAKVFGKRKYNVLHRSANRYNRRVAMIKTLVGELKANAPGVFTSSEADKRALHLCAKQIVEKAWKEGVEIGTECESRKIRRNERAYYLKAVCTAYHLGDDDDAFWKALETAPNPHQA